MLRVSKSDSGGVVSVRAYVSSEGTSSHATSVHRLYSFRDGRFESVPPTAASCSGVTAGLF